MVCIPLTVRHHATQRKWAADHRNWMQSKWNQVMFTYKSRLSLECDTRYVLVWTATAGSDVVQSGRPIFDDFSQHL
ncbi:hypothetical protein TNCV_1338901 [Trichonephila clavipes]|nr:hypothetical protein TNCV_1338901 [Trichonephila clavipes]